MTDVPFYNTSFFVDKLLINNILLYKLQCFTRISTTEKCGI